MSLLPLDRSRLRWLAIATATCLAGCGGSQVIVESTFPRPVIEPLPVSMGIVIPDELYNFIYTEDIPDQSLWTIALGDANVAMLAPLFEGMFRDTTDLDSLALAAADTTLDGVIEPKLEKFEFDVPQGERDEFVEVWLQYQITVYEPDGATVIQWPVSGLRQIGAAAGCEGRRAARRHRGDARSWRDNCNQVQRATANKAVVRGYRS